MRFTCILALGAFLISGVASGQTYPDKGKPIRIVVPYSAGASADTLARALSRGMAEVAGVNVVVDNRGGGEGVIGVVAVKTAAPDGYTMLLTSGSTQVVNPHMMANLPYDPFADFVPLAGVTKASMYFHVSPSVKFKTLGDFIADARTSPEKYTVGSGSATMLMAGEMLNQAAGIKLLSVPFKNATDAVTAMAASQVDLVIVDAAMASPHYPRGVRALATTTPARTQRFPDLPTAVEEGVSGYQVVGWFGTYFPAHTPPAIQASMRELLVKALKTKYVTDVLSNFAMDPFEGDLAAWERADYERWGKAVRAANMDPKK